jgi:nitroimidazol reductase NimA-like FMN-containing flavoprotein (pyridoxamine 5'-phosphate oxidase superfamily)
MPDQNQMTKVRDRMQRERTLWMATTRPDGRPHVAPIWFVWHADCCYVMTGGVKLANVRHNNVAALNSEDGIDVVIVEGTARIVAPEEDRFAAVARLFDERYEWNIREVVGEQQLIEVTPVKTLVWNAE